MHIIFKKMYGSIEMLGGGGSNGPHDQPWIRAWVQEL